MVAKGRVAYVADPAVCCASVVETPLSQAEATGLAHVLAALADPPLKLVLIEDANQTPGTLNHLGVEVPTTDDVTAAQVRLSGEGLATALEEETSCCYAVQDKVWVDGPGGEPWEIYTVLSDTEMPAGQLRSAAPGESACCSSRPEAVEATAGSSSCC